jgi:hypothetical protein
MSEIILNPVSLSASLARLRLLIAVACDPLVRRIAGKSSRCLFSASRHDLIIESSVDRFYRVHALGGYNADTWWSLTAVAALLFVVVDQAKLIVKVTYAKLSDPLPYVDHSLFILMIADQSLWCFPTA